MRALGASVKPVHFEDFDGKQFERLVFAYLLRTGNWRSLEWYGQVGSDLGRDIWGVREDDHFREGEKVCVQCANRKQVPLTKATRDIDKVVKAPNGVPDTFILVAGSNVSADLRDKTKQYAKSKKVDNCEVWSGPELEEMLRAKAESLLKRFVGGEEFPDTPQELREFVTSGEAASDEEILALMAGLFDRPAFYTPFHQESSVPAFKKAITDTIEALNTGVHRLRDGTIIRRIPSRHQLKDEATKKALAEMERKLCQLRSTYEEMLRTDEIRPCGCDYPECPVFFMSHRASREMDRQRDDILFAFRRLYPKFDVRVGWRY